MSAQLRQEAEDLPRRLPGAGTCAPGGPVRADRRTKGVRTPPASTATRARTGRTCTSSRTRCSSSTVSAPVAVAAAAAKAAKATNGPPFAGTTCEGAARRRTWARASTRAWPSGRDPASSKRWPTSFPASTCSWPSAGARRQTHIPSATTATATAASSSKKKSGSRAGRRRTAPTCAGTPGWRKPGTCARPSPGSSGGRARTRSIGRSFTIPTSGS